ncbi:hypothetical protein L3C95_11110 [Chitinophaga filiformis]|uniref:hypothetical protein n=1 Tax=Chitinophaga filiformis TaxID=104663 RepID=UPI001F161BCC|nr:hypothetical protein [Chitinophaga filiformis]MCF6402654.1 hypothetical protein [Chitinophaga filiformis]MCF6403428.1 hypothetical protein [Chitinophaga filiformis]
MKQIFIFLCLISMLSCSKENGRSFKGVVTTADNCCSSTEGGRLYKVNILGTDSTVTTVLPAEINLGDTIAFNMHATDTPPAVLCLAICVMPEMVRLSDVSKVQ